MSSQHFINLSPVHAQTYWNGWICAAFSRLCPPSRHRYWCRHLHLSQLPTWCQCIHGPHMCSLWHRHTDTYKYNGLSDRPAVLRIIHSLSLFSTLSYAPSPYPPDLHNHQPVALPRSPHRPHLEQATGCRKSGMSLQLLLAHPDLRLPPKHRHRREEWKKKSRQKHILLWYEILSRHTSYSIFCS